MGARNTVGSTFTNVIEDVAVDLSVGVIFGPFYLGSQFSQFRLGRFRQTIYIRVPTRFLNVTVVVFGLTWFFAVFAPYIWASIPAKEAPSTASADKLDAVSKCLQKCWGFEYGGPDRRLGCVNGCMMGI